MSRLPLGTVLVGDAGQRLRQLPPASVDCIVTSPPYFALRNYGRRDQLGLEPNVDVWVGRLLLVIDELARVLKSDGVLWLNLGDSYSRHHQYGVPPKGLLLAPERLLLALSARGWLVRNKVVWAKQNPMPASVTDRLSCTWEPIYLLTRSSTYYFDLDVIRAPHRSRPKIQSGQTAAPPCAERRRGPARWRATSPDWRGSKQPAWRDIRWARTRGTSGRCPPATAAAPTTPPSRRAW